MNITKLDITEKEWESQVKKLAKLFQWRYYHTFLSKWSERGWPDVTLLRGSRLILAELKSEKGKLTIAQVQWLWALRKVSSIEVYIWRPRHFEKIARILR